MLSTLTKILGHLPSIAKYLFFILLALNAHSLPTVWHFRFWWRLGPKYWHILTRGRKAYLEDCAKQIHAKGGVSARSVMKRRAWIDDCDHNMHLSNSCYAKSADICMSAWVWDNLAVFIEGGGFPALAGTHYTFIREIPILSAYTVEARAVGWGDKWIYLVTEFVIYPKKKSSSRRKTVDSSTPGSITPSPASGAITPPEAVLPGTNTTSPSGPPSNPTNNPSTVSPDLAGLALAALRTPKPRTDGGVVAAIAVHEVCIKIGRITVPPRIGFHFGGHSPTPAARAAATALASNKKAGAAWLAGGWKAESNAADIGRDILPSMTSSGINAGGDEKETQAVEQRIVEQLESSVKGMEKVIMGLGETVRL